jgi:lipopolysaccharide/colanic/teichoic acid biosynthesis glycosyltransferase
MRRAGLGGAKAIRVAQTERAKRAFDIAFALVVLVLSAPVLLLSMLAIRIDSPGPALYRQCRLGKDGRTFELLKLRGMFVDARTRFPHLYRYDQVQQRDIASYFFHKADDPRVTRVGRLVRKFSIDELPNFWNVLRGDMSVVGPRPEIPELTHLYGEDLELLLSVRPGVTSPAKASGRDELSFSETLALELDYVAHRSFSLDLRTIAQTVGGVIRGSRVR